MPRALAGSIAELLPALIAGLALVTWRFQCVN